MVVSLREKLRVLFCDVTLNKYAEYYCTPSLLDEISATGILELVCDLIGDRQIKRDVVVLPASLWDTLSQMRANGKTIREIVSQCADDGLNVSTLMEIEKDIVFWGVLDGIEHVERINYPR